MCVPRESLDFRGQWAHGGHQGMAFLVKRYKTHCLASESGKRRNCHICSFCLAIIYSKSSVMYSFTQGDGGIHGDRGRKGDKGDNGKPGSSGPMVPLAQVLFSKYNSLTTCPIHILVNIVSLVIQNSAWMICPLSCDLFFLTYIVFLLCTYKYIFPNLSLISQGKPGEKGEPGLTVSKLTVINIVYINIWHFWH